MKFSADRAQLLEAVTRLQKVVGSKTVMPVLEGILISAEPGKLTLAAYNLENGMKKEIYANCSEAGDIVINARLLGDILRKMTGIQVETEADEKLKCTIKSGETSFEIMGMAAVDFPEMPSLSDGDKITADAQILNDMVKRTIFAVSQIEGTKPILTGIDIKISSGIMQLVAIDGYRLAVRRRRVETQENIEFVASGRAISEMVKLIDENTENVNITVGKRLASFEIDGYVFICRLLEGEFVNYEKIIPEKFVQEMVLNCEELTETAERVSLIINDTFSYPIRCCFDGGKAVITTATGVGRARETINVDYTGEKFEIGLNCRYLLDALRACDSGDLLFKFNGANGGVVITSADESKNDFIYLVMPMRLK